jgi:exo-beta-1,3-glucanase (GH17 family)
MRQQKARNLFRFTVFVLLGTLLFCCDGSSGDGQNNAAQNGIVKLSITNNDDNTIVPRYSLDGGTEQDFPSLAANETKEVSISAAAGSHSVEIVWNEPDTGDIYRKGPTSQTVNANQTTVWSFSIDKHQPVPTVSTAIITLVNNDDNTVSPKYSLNGGAWTDFGSLTPGEIKSISLNAPIGSAAVSISWVEPDTGLTYFKGPVTQTIVAGQTTVWNFSIDRHLPPPTTGSLSVNISNGDDDAITAEVRLDSGTWNNLGQIASGATTAYSFGSLAPGSYSVTLRWYDADTGQTYSKTASGTINAGDSLTWSLAIDLNLPPQPTTGTVKIAVNNGDDNTISPQYQIDGGVWTNISAVASGANIETSFTVSVGTKTIRISWLDPSDGQTYYSASSSQAVVGGQTTTWDFTIDRHLPPAPTTGTINLKISNTDNDVITPRYQIDNGVLTDFMPLNSGETKEINLTASPGSHSVSISWFDNDTQQTYNQGPVSQIIYAGVVTSWSFSIDNHEPIPLSKYRGSFNFSPYEDGQDPNLLSVISEAQIRARLSIIAPYTERIRIFGTEYGLEKIPAIASEFGIETYVGAWLSKDLAANERQLANLIAIGQSGKAAALIVGSEVLLRNDLTTAQLIAYIQRVKQAVPGVPVTTAEVHGIWETNAALIAEVDFLMVNYYAFWEGVNIDNALASIHGYHSLVKARAGGKKVVVSETGWPSGGNQNGNAVPSPENAAKYFLNFVSWARANNVEYFYFEAFDETWKAAYEGLVGKYWGVWDKDGVMKPGMQRVFDNEVMPDNWSSAALTGGEGTPAIELTSVPALGSTANLYGYAWHILPADCKIVVYIKVGYNWWVKPYYASPLTYIANDGSWVCDITTGGSDQNASQIAVYLIPNDYSPPLVGGVATLPAELETSSLARVIVTRP